MLPGELRDGLTFEDVLLVPAASEILPRDTDVATWVTRRVRLNIPVISAVGQPLTATSVNLSGQPGGFVDEAALRELRWPPGDLVFVVVDDEAVAHSAPSTLVRLTGPELEILRPGPVSAQALHEQWR